MQFLNNYESNRKDNISLDTKIYDSILKIAKININNNIL